MADIDLYPFSDFKKKVLRVQPEGRKKQAAQTFRRARLSATAPYLLIFVIGACLYVSADNIEFDRVEGRIGPDLWPKIILGLMMIASAWGTIKALLLPPAVRIEQQPSTLEDVESSRPAHSETDEREIYPLRVWGTLAGSVAYLLVMPLLGFFSSSLVFIAFVIYLGGYRKPVRVLVVSLVASLFFMIIFVRVVYVSLPIGIEPFAKISLALIKLINL